MRFRSLMSAFSSAGGTSGALQWISWPSFWRGGLIALCLAFALSTQLLFQFDLYGNWPLSDILFGWRDHFVDQVIVGGCICIGIAIAVLVPTRSGFARLFLLPVAITLGALAGEALLLLRVPLPPGTSLFGVLLGRGARWLVIGGLGYVFFVFQRQAAEAATSAHEIELQRIQLDRQMTEARLQWLRAQIEPHFLFNTLANIRQLYRTEPNRGRLMLGNFIAYLRAALPQMRRDETTLKREVDLARAYLGVLQVRMGERLKTCFDIPQDLATLAFPPFALSTLTENAIKHGLNPLPEGGSIGIAARVEDSRLKVDVSDNGAGIRQSSGSGNGLANLRARLSALYGETATLSIVANTPRGIRATIVVPLRTARPDGQQ